MSPIVQNVFRRLRVPLLLILIGGALASAVPAGLAAQPQNPSEQAIARQGGGGGEANLILPDLSTVAFRGVNARTLLKAGLLVCVLGLLFGLMVFTQTRKLPVHPAMREISELIYETCKTYLITQGKFILVLELFIGVIIVLYFGVLERLAPMRVAIILAFSLIGIGGSYGVAWFGIRVNTFANSRAAFASLRGKPFPI